jgi:hypothetical protein
MSRVPFKPGGGRVFKDEPPHEKQLAGSSWGYVVEIGATYSSALELPLIYRGDDNGNVNLVDNIK